MNLDELRFFDPRGEIDFSANRLPHWQQNEGIYFATFRLADSVPKHLFDEWIGQRDCWLRIHPQPWSQVEEREYFQRFTATMECWLDAGHGACVLRRQACASVVASTLRHFDGKRCDLFAFVIMPNHVHVLVRLTGGQDLGKVLHSWKSFSAHRINAVLGSRGRVWQRDYFDRLVRDGAHFRRCVRYIRRNPTKARLRTSEYLLYESNLSRAIE